MKSKDKIMLTKILNYITELQEFINGYSKEQFIADKKTINACVFNLSQIGELAGKVSDELMLQNSHIEWRGLKALRNRIVHDYDGVNLNMIWDFLSDELDELFEQIQSIVSNE